jgi:hypothetical protein
MEAIVKQATVNLPKEIIQKFRDQNKKKKVSVVLDDGTVVDPVIFYTHFNKNNVIKSLVPSDRRDYDYKCGHIYYLKEWIKPIVETPEFNITPMAEIETQTRNIINRTDLKRLLLKYLGILEFNNVKTEDVLNKIRKELYNE